MKEEFLQAIKKYTPEQQRHVKALWWLSNDKESFQNQWIKDITGKEVA